MPGKIFVILILVCWPSSAFCDTFTHTGSGATHNGYATSKTNNGKTEVMVEGGEKLLLNMAEYKVSANSLGRNNIVPVVSIMDSISMEMETKAFEEALVEESDKGPLFILIEVDTPGGRVSFAKRLCAAITNLKNCKTVAFIKGGENGGAYSAGVAVSLSCNEIYMSPETVIGAATVVTRSKGKTVAISEVYDEHVAEKTSSAWRNYLSSLAQQNGRPGMLAKAMVDKEYDIVEVIQDGERVFIESSEKKTGQKVVKTWSKKDELLTLPAKDAIACGMADKIIATRPELLADLGASKAEVVTNKKMERARIENKRLSLQMKKMWASLDLKWKKIGYKQTRRKRLKDVRGIIADCKKLKKLNKQYPDVDIDEEKLDEYINTITAYYDSLR